jgi:hypothetical protein
MTLCGTCGLHVRIMESVSAEWAVGCYHLHVFESIN